MATATTVKFKASELRKMLVACGVDTAVDWPMKKLKKKVDGGVAKYKEDTHTIKDDDLAQLYDDLVAAQENGDEVDIEDDITEAKPAKPPKAEKPATDKSAGKTRKKRAEGEARVAPSWEELKEIWKKTPQTLTGRGEGKIKFIVDTLIARGKGKDPKGITKEGMLGLMQVKFPNGDAKKMMTTINNQIPSRLKLVRHIYVWRNPDTKGYYIAGDGSEPQEKTAKAAKTKPSTNGDDGKESPKAVKKPAAKPAAKAAKAAKPASKPAEKGK